MVSKSSDLSGRPVEKMRWLSKKKDDPNEGRDWLPPVILLGDERYRLRRIRPVYWEDNV